jgi:hypothetical protein
LSRRWSVHPPHRTTALVTLALEVGGPRARSSTAGSPLARVLANGPETARAILALTRVRPTVDRRIHTASSVPSTGVTSLIDGLTDHDPVPRG